MDFSKCISDKEKLQMFSDATGNSDDGASYVEVYPDEAIAFANAVIDRISDAALALAGDAQPVAIVSEGSGFGPGLAFLVGGKDLPKPGTRLYAAPPLPVTQDASIDALALAAITRHFNEFVGACMHNGEPFMPSKRAISQARACLPPTASNSFNPRITEAAAVPAVAQDAQDIRNATLDEAAAMFFDSRKDSYVARTLLGMKSTATGGVQSLPAVAPAEASDLTEEQIMAMYYASEPKNRDPFSGLSHDWVKAFARAVLAAARGAA